MPVVKCTALFSYASNAGGTAANTRAGGWSESIYSQSSQLSTTRENFEWFCQKRASLLGNAARIIGQRYQRIDPLGHSVSGARVFPGNTIKSDVPQMAVTFTVPGVGVPNSRRFTLRGIADARVVDGEFNPSPEFVNNLQATVMALGPFCFRAKQQVTDQVGVTSIAADGTFILQQPLTFAANNYLNVSRARPAVGDFISGRFHVQTFTDTQHGKFDNWVGVATVGGFAKLDETIFPAFDATVEVTPIVVVRKVGRPFGGYRGRASARR